MISGIAVAINLCFMLGFMHAIRLCQVRWQFVLLTFNPLVIESEQVPLLHSSRGLGRGPLKAKTRVRIPYGAL
jgi:hypothetical protein